MVYKFIQCTADHRMPDGSIATGRSIAYSLHSGLVAWYGPGIRTVPVVGYLFAFSDKESARLALTYESGLGRFQLWSASAVVVASSPRILLDVGDLKLIKRFWSEYHALADRGPWWESFDREWTFPPLGTVLCSEITLKERVL